MITYVSGIPPITFEIHALESMEEQAAVRTALHVHVDQPTGVSMVSLYFDDERGNGSCILSLPLAELRRIARDLWARDIKGQP